MSDVAKTIEAVWKIESTRLIAAIARVTRDIGIAEELAQDALVTALELWPREGIPENPGAWLMTAVEAQSKRASFFTLRILRWCPSSPREGLYPSHTLGDALFPGFLVRLDLLRYILKALLPFAEHFGALLSGPSQANHAKPESAV